jgi:hypothetical protein
LHQLPGFLGLTLDIGDAFVFGAAAAELALACWNCERIPGLVGVVESRAIGNGEWDKVEFRLTGRWQKLTLREISTPHANMTLSLGVS